MCNDSDRNDPKKDSEHKSANFSEERKKEEERKKAEETKDPRTQHTTIRIHNNRDSG
jgi:hypothetical protein